MVISTARNLGISSYVGMLTAPFRPLDKRISLLPFLLFLGESHFNFFQYSSHEALPGVLKNMGIRPFTSGEQGNKSLKVKETGEHRQFWGTGNIKNQDFDFGKQGKMPPIFRGTREQVHVPPWEGLSHTPSFKAVIATFKPSMQPYSELFRFFFKKHTFGI